MSADLAANFSTSGVCAREGQYYTEDSAGTKTAMAGTAAELNKLAGVTAGTVTASKAVVVDANKDVSSFRDIAVRNLDAGASGTAGSLDIFPTTASKGKTSFTSADNTGNTTTTIATAEMGQTTALTIPDPDGATGTFVISTGVSTKIAATSTELDTLNAVTPGTVAASKAVVVDSNKDAVAFRNVTVTNLDAGASGTAGSVDVFPATSARGKTAITSTNNTGDTTTTINVGAQAGAVTYTVPDAAASASFVLLTTPQTAAGVLSRADFAQATLAHSIALTNLRVWDAIQTNLPGTAASDDLAIINGTFLTTAPTIRTSDAKAAVVEQKARFQFAVPEHYVAGQAITLVMNCGMVTTVSDNGGATTVDALVVRTAAPTVDICATAAMTINSLTASDKTFTITATNVVVGDILECVVVINITDAATGTAVIGQINTITLNMATKG